jgi:hypothetical protein
MKTLVRNSSSRREEGAILAYFIILLIAIGAITSVAAYVTQTTKLAKRRSDMVVAYQYATAGAVMACADLNTAVTNGGNTILENLKALPSPYTVNNSLSTSSQKVLQRTISSPFTNQTVNAQIWVPLGNAPTSAKIVTTAVVGDVSQTTTVNVKMAWSFPAAIVSVNDGTTSSGVAKAVAQDGNVVVNGDKSGPIIVDGNVGLAIDANGRINIDTNYINAPASAYSMTNYNTANQIPDFTAQGTSNTLFDINRFIAVADHTTNLLSVTQNNHFTNIISFMNTVTNYPGTSTNTMLQGVVVVDIWSTDKDLGNLTDTKLPKGINIEGTLLFNFLGSGWDPTTSKIIITAALNINPADLSHLVATNPATYTTGYPATYADPTKNPVNINISPYGYVNFTAFDDLPALVYSIGVVDIHGPVDISGVCYTPSYMEIENKTSGATQYFKGSLIMGNGIYYENTTPGATSIISFDPAAVDALATLNATAKQVKVAYWQ